MLDINKLGTSDLHSYELILKEIREQQLTLSEDFGVDNIGYNEASGHVWAILDSNIILYSVFGQKVGYMIDDYETGEEHAFNTEEEALKKQEELSE